MDLRSQPIPFFPIYMGFNACAYTHQSIVLKKRQVLYELAVFFKTLEINRGLSSKVCQGGVLIISYDLQKRKRNFKTKWQPIKCFFFHRLRHALKADGHNQRQSRVFFRKKRKSHFCRKISKLNIENKLCKNLKIWLSGLTRPEKL